MVDKILCLVALLTLLVNVEARAAGPVFWDWPADRSFDELEFSGAALDQNGHVVAGMTTQPLGSLGPEIFWRIVADGKGGFYTGTGHGGEVYHTDAKGESQLLAALDCTEIFSLLVLPNGELLVGCGPEGHLYRLTSTGASRQLGTVDGGYIWQMILAPEGNIVWLATGSPAGLVRLDLSSEELTTVLTLPAQNALAVHVAPGGDILIATQGPGLVYRYTGGDEGHLIYETAQDEARQFIVGPANELYLLALQMGVAELTNLSNGNGKSADIPPSLMPLLATESDDDVAAAALYHLASDGAVNLYWSGDVSVMTVAWSPRWGWLAAGEMAADGDQAVLRQLMPPSGDRDLARWVGGDVLDIMVPENDGDDLVLAQAHPGALVGIGTHPKTPRRALSKVLDGGGLVQWGRLSWRAEGGHGQPKWSVRTGNRQEPDASWTDWNKAWTETDHALQALPSRYLQWRVDLPAQKKGEVAWRVTGVSLSAWQENLAPVITEFQLEHLQDISLGGMLRGTENVTQRFRSGLLAEYSQTMMPDLWAGPDRGAMSRAIRIFTWVATDANDDRLSYQLEYCQLGTEAWRPVSTNRSGSNETFETLVSWDTSEVTDGPYEMRLTASDRRDNPGDLALSSQRNLGPLLVDNTAPTISRLAVQKTESGFLVSCRAEDDTTILAGARIVLPDGSAERLDPLDRICDSQREDFKTEVTWPRPGQDAGPEPWQVKIELRDLGGNVSVATEIVR